MIQVSAGTAHVLGLRRIRSTVDPTTGYFLAGGSCGGSCAFCPQSTGTKTQLSRVHWPEFDQGAVFKALGQGTSLRRLCFQMAANPTWIEAALKYLTRLRRDHPTMPVCVSCRPQSLAEIGELLAAGADKVSLALDACTPAVAAAVGRDWDHVRPLLTAAAAKYPGRIGTHLIIGLGESEAEAEHCMAELLAEGTSIGLFAFTPVRGTVLAEQKPPGIGRYRRLQAALYLLRTHGERAFFHPSGRISFSEPQKQLLQPQAFETAGCPDCNRPYYNERPGGVMYNYPYPLAPAEFAQCCTELEVQP